MFTSIGVLLNESSSKCYGFMNKQIYMCLYLTNHNKCHHLPRVICFVVCNDSYTQFDNGENYINNELIG